MSENTSPINELDLDGENRESDERTYRSGESLFGTLSITGGEEYYVFVKQAKLRTTWMLTTTEVFNTPIKERKDCLKAVLVTTASGSASGMGDTYILMRCLDNINYLVGRATKLADLSMFINKFETRLGDRVDSDFIQFSTIGTTKFYRDILMSYEGFRLSLNPYNTKFPIEIPKKLNPVMTEKSTAAVIAGLGVQSFEILKRRKGKALDWFDKKNYKLITTNEQFRNEVMTPFLDAVQEAANAGTARACTIDTETTGLNVFNLSVSNPMRDHIVAIPFGFKQDEAYVICVDMEYFPNVDGDEIFPLFQTLFSRNEDYTFQDIELDYNGKHYKFNRKNILLIGVNSGFDMCAFFSENCDIFFDEDIQIMHYNLATDWVQGKNGLKAMTRRYLNVETLELDELFGPAHKDKYRYLSDEKLALCYGGADGDFPIILWKKLRRVTDNNLYALYRKYDMTTLYRTSKATWQGLFVDEVSVKQQGESVLKDLDTLKNFVYKYAYIAYSTKLQEKSEQLNKTLGLDSSSNTSNQVEFSAETIDSESGMYRYTFTPRNHKNLLFNVLGYPVISVSASGEPTLDKFVLKKLISFERDVPSEQLKHDIPSVSSSKPLIKAKDFNKLMYPLALIFKKYAELNKEYTAYYKPLLDNDIESHMFYRFSMQRAATRRILSPGQTMKGSLKKLVLAPRGKLFMCFDASQIEYRHMASLAYVQTKKILMKSNPDNWQEELEKSGIHRIVTMMHNPEADYHIETASMMTGLPQYRIDSDTRKMYKSIGFGIPYGLGKPSMCESLFGKVTPENMEATTTILDDYGKKNYEIIRLLESARDQAFYPAKVCDELREMLGTGETPLGIVNNFVGFYRLFILEDLTKSRVGRIRRQAGNCLIQGGAAELFRRMLYNFHVGCCGAGISNKVDWLMLVHDEVDTVVDDDIDVCKLIDVLYSSCTLRYADHIPYFIGIGFGSNWYDAKGDGAELPVIMVERLVKAYRAGKFSLPCDGRQAQNLLEMKRHYMCDRLYEELISILPNIGAGYEFDEEDAELVDKEFSNYMVRAYLKVFVSKEHVKQYESNKEGVPLSVMLQDWLVAREEYGFGKDFLSVKYADAREELISMDLSDDVVSDVDIDEVDIEFSADELFLDILDNSDEEMAYNDREGEFFGETELFDENATKEDIENNHASKSFKAKNISTKQEEEEPVLNPNATSAFDLYLTEKYVRKHILRASDNNYSVVLTGTPMSNNVNVVADVIRKSFNSGTANIVIIGKTIKRISGISDDSQKLDQLDMAIEKLLNGG